MQEVITKINELLENQTVDRVLAWKVGEFDYERTPAVFTKDALDGIAYDSFCAANLAKYLINETKKPGKVAILAKPCDTYNLNLLIKEHRIDREKVYIVAVPCKCKIDVEKLRAKGIKGIKGVKEDGETLVIDTIYGEKTCPRNEAIQDKCLACQGKVHVVFDEKIESDEVNTVEKVDRMIGVEELEAMSPQERFDFWRSQLSKCIRCNACRNACPACTCTTCVFDNPASGIASKANTDSFEENMFHIIRAFHVAGRCTDCGECSRVCPQNIPLHLLNRKFIKEMNELYGTYQSGEDATSKGPLTSFTKGDVEPSIVYEKGRG